MQPLDAKEVIIHPEDNTVTIHCGDGTIRLFHCEHISVEWMHNSTTTRAKPAEEWDEIHIQATGQHRPLQIGTT